MQQSSLDPLGPKLTTCMEECSVVMILPTFSSLECGKPIEPLCVYVNHTQNMTEALGILQSDALQLMYSTSHLAKMFFVLKVKYELIYPLKQIKWK